MDGSRQVALDLQQDIATSGDTSCVTKRLAGKSKTEIEQICSLEIDGRTVFQTIASYDRANILEKILSYGVNINKVDRYAVHVAISQKAVDVMKILLAHKTNIDCATDGGKTPLHIASELGYIKIVRELLENGAKSMLNQPEKTGCTPLTLACMTDHRETATCLMIYGAAINFEGAFPPLHAAALMGYFDLVRMLLEKGAYVNLRDAKGETALHYASYKSHQQIVQLLLQKGAKVSCFDARGRTPVDLATDGQIKRLLEYKLKTEGNANEKSRRGSAFGKLFPLAVIPVNPNISQPNVDDKILDEQADETRKNGKSSYKSNSKEQTPDHNIDNKGGKHESDRGESQKNGLNANCNNSSVNGTAAALQKKVLEQLTYSADSEIGERNTKFNSPFNHARNSNDNNGEGRPRTSNESGNAKTSKEKEEEDSSSSRAFDVENGDQQSIPDEKQQRKAKKKKGDCVIF